MVDNQAKDIDIDHIIDKLLEVRGYAIAFNLPIFYQMPPRKASQPHWIRS